MQATPTSHRRSPETRRPLHSTAVAHGMADGIRHNEQFHEEPDIFPLAIRHFPLDVFPPLKPGGRTFPPLCKLACCTENHTADVSRISNVLES